MKIKGTKTRVRIKEDKEYKVKAPPGSFGENWHGIPIDKLFKGGK